MSLLRSQQPDPMAPVGKHRRPLFPVGWAACYCRQLLVALDLAWGLERRHVAAWGSAGGRGSEYVSLGVGECWRRWGSAITVDFAERNSDATGGFVASWWRKLYAWRFALQFVVHVPRLKVAPGVTVASPTVRLIGSTSVLGSTVFSAVVYIRPNVFADLQICTRKNIFSTQVILGGCKA